jgi:hypothetical protein
MCAEGDENPEKYQEGMSISMLSLKLRSEEVVMVAPCISAVLHNVCVVSVTFLHIVDVRHRIGN